MDIVHVANKVKVSVHKNCKTTVEGGEAPDCEFLVYLSVPKAGGDGILLGVCETEEAAETIASTLSLVLSIAHTHS